MYDQDCGLCRYLLAKVLTWDRRGALRPLPLQSSEAEALLQGMSEEQRMGSWHLVERDGAVASAGAAFPPLLRRLPGGQPLAALAAAAPRLTERSYRLISGNRDRLGPRIPAHSKERADRRLAERRRR
ncbi:MAG: thiol-disulfide oxidoreductase DCC family protein [Solirubrobacterales bacterium]